MTEESGTDDGSTDPESGGESDESESDSLPPEVRDQIERQRALREAYLEELEAEGAGAGTDEDGCKADDETDERDSETEP